MKRLSRENTQYDSHEQMEEQLARALYGEAIGQVGPYQLFHLCSDNSFALFVCGDIHSRIHKYVYAKDSVSREFVLAMPIEWCGSHKDIFSRLKRCCGLDLACLGGGFVVSLNKKVMAYGLSCEYGTGDHRRAEDLFKQAMASRRDPQPVAA